MPERSPQDYIAQIHTFTSISMEMSTLLRTYVELLLHWNKKINLIGARQEDKIWERHVIDCAQLVRHIPPGTGDLIDFGSGAGLPGIILAIMTNKQVHLIESDKRKCAFLREAASKLELKNVYIHAERIETIKPWPVEYITARALAPLHSLLELTNPFTHTKTSTFFLKGKTLEQEISDAKLNWDFHYEVFQSITDSHGSVISIHSTHKRPKS